MRPKNVLRLALASLVLSAMAFADLTVSSPASGATVPSPVRVIASATSSRPITGMKVYVDGQSTYSTTASSIDTSLPLASGTRYMVIKAWDSSGAVFSSSRTITVSGTTSISPSTGGTTYTSSNITISSPANGATVSSPVRFVASASASAPITAMHIYANNTQVYGVSGNTIDTSVTLGSGAQYVVVQAWDSNGTVYKRSLNITVSGSSTTGEWTTGGVSLSEVDEMTGWKSCDTCSGPGGDGYITPHSMSQFVDSPSLDGDSIKFWLGGDQPYASALWWKQLGARDEARRFRMEMSFYFTDHSAIQALEFDTNQSVNGWKHIFGSECNQRTTGGTWRVWEAVRTYAKGGSWKDTGIPCKPEAYKWNTLVWEFERLSNGYVKYVSVTLNGVKHYVNRTYTAEPSSVRELNVAFQMDGNYRMDDYIVHLDKVSLTYWQ